MPKKTDRIITLIICLRNARLLVRILLVGDLLQPRHRTPVDRFCDGDMGHRRLRACAVPVLHAGWDPGDIPPDSAVPPLSPTPVTSRAPASRSAFVQEDAYAGAVRAPGSKVTVAPPTFAGSVASERRVNAHAAGKPRPLDPERKVTNRYG